VGHSAVPRAYPEIERSAFVPHAAFQPGRWTGVIHLTWTVPPAHPVVIGAGWYGVRGGEAEPDRRPNLGPRRRQPLRVPPIEVVAEIVRRGSAGVPVLPGSSLKGAVRQVYELLTPSCQLAPGGACRVSVRERDPQVCPACSLFGGAGLGGRLAFGEAEPAAANWKPLTGVRRTPMAWQPGRPQEGTVRVYGQRRAVLPDGRPAGEEESTWAAWGQFRSRLRLSNASDEELGILFASLGLGADSPMVRVGGKKYHGFGAADVALVEARRAHPPPRAVVQAADLNAWALGLVDRWVSQVPARQTTWKALHDALGA